VGKIFDHCGQEYQEKFRVFIDQPGWFSCGIGLLYPDPSLGAR
jgi:hypothetical protein